MSNEIVPALATVSFCNVNNNRKRKCKLVLMASMNLTHAGEDECRTALDEDDIGGGGGAEVVWFRLRLKVSIAGVERMSRGIEF